MTDKKICTKCEELKNTVEDFYFHKKRGVSSNTCKSCVYKKNKEYLKNYYSRNKEKMKKRQRKYSKENKLKIKEYYLKNKERLKEYYSNYRKTRLTREKREEYNLKYISKNKEKIKEYYKLYYLKNRDRILNKQKEQKKIQ